MGFARDLRKWFEVKEVGIHRLDEEEQEELRRDAEMWRRDNIHLYVIGWELINVLLIVSKGTGSCGRKLEASNRWQRMVQERDGPM